MTYHFVHLILINNVAYVPHPNTRGIEHNYFYSLPNYMYSTHKTHDSQVEYF